MLVFRTNPVAVFQLNCIAADHVDRTTHFLWSIKHHMVWNEKPKKVQGNEPIVSFSGIHFTLHRGTQRRFLPKCTAFQSTLRSLEMHSKWRYKICICSVIIGNLEAFRNYKGFSVIFPKRLDTIERFTKMRIFLIPHSIIFLNPKILGFLFLRNQPNVGSKMWKIKQKIVESS